MPKNTNEWLNTYHINDVFEQYEKIYSDFKFMGANPRDFDKLPSTGIPDSDYDKLIKSGKFRLGFIFNLDKHNESGSHGVALYADLMKHQIYFIDSVGDEPDKEFVVLMERIADFCKKNVRKIICESQPDIVQCKNISVDSNEIDMRYNKKQHQHGNSECGVYAISFILRLLDGESFDDIVNHKISDNEIKLCRTPLFKIINFLE